VAICDRLAHTVETVLGSEDMTNRAAKLLGLVVRAVIVSVIGTVVVIAFTMISAPWWALGSAGVTALAGGAALIRRRQVRHQLSSPSLASHGEGATEGTMFRSCTESAADVF
jgi:hypothetical protein